MSQQRHDWEGFDAWANGDACAAYGRVGQALELPAWPSNNEASLSIGLVGCEGVEGRQLTGSIGILASVLEWRIVLFSSGQMWEKFMI